MNLALYSLLQDLDLASIASGRVLSEHSFGKIKVLGNPFRINSFVNLKVFGNPFRINSFVNLKV